MKFNSQEFLQSLRESVIFKIYLSFFFMKSLKAVLKDVENELANWQEQDQQILSLVANAIRTRSSFQALGRHSSGEMVQGLKPTPGLDGAISRAEANERASLEILFGIMELQKDLKIMIALPFWDRISYFRKHILGFGICFLFYVLILGLVPLLDIHDTVQYNSSSSKKIIGKNYLRVC